MIRSILKRFKIIKEDEMPESFQVPNLYNLPVHDQGNKKNCTSHAFASMMEYHLSKRFKERTLVDVDDLWEKQKKFGTAKEEVGDYLDGPIIIARKYGVRFKTDSGKQGTFFLSDKTKKIGGIKCIQGFKKIIFD